MPITSAGILLFRGRGPQAAVFLVHPGGPYWATKDDGVWSVPKGIVEPDEEHLVCARREFREETGFDAVGAGRDLGVFRHASGKFLHVWAIEGDCDPSKLKSNTFEIEWPPRSNTLRSFPEVDRAGWFEEPEALRKILKGQRPIIEMFFAEP